MRMVMNTDISATNNRAHTRPRVVIIGAGFGGLTAAKSLSDAQL